MKPKSVPVAPVAEVGASPTPPTIHQREAQMVDNMQEEARQIGDALRYCLTGVEIIGCPSPSLMDEALERLERMAGNESEFPQPGCPEPDKCAKRGPCPFCEARNRTDPGRSAEGENGESWQSSLSSTEARSTESSEHSKTMTSASGSSDYHDTTPPTSSTSSGAGSEMSPDTTIGRTPNRPHPGRSTEVHDG